MSADQEHSPNESEFDSEPSAPNSQWPGNAPNNQWPGNDGAEAVALGQTQPLPAVPPPAAIPPPAPSQPVQLPSPDHHGEQPSRSEEHTSELQSPYDLVCRLLLEKKNDDR